MYASESKSNRLYLKLECSRLTGAERQVHRLILDEQPGGRMRIDLMQGDGG